MTDNKKSFLDDFEYIKKLDRGNCLSSIKLLPEQILSVWNNVREFEFNIKKNDISNLIFSGMGGSSYGARIIKSLFKDRLKLPVEIITDYHLPKFAGQKSLVIAVSYSGDTEETISCTEDALMINSHIIAVTSGGKMEKILKNHQKRVFVFDTEFNPSLQPRLGQGYLTMSQMAILAKLNLIDIRESEITQVIKLLQKQQENIGVNSPVKNNPAKKLAIKASEKIINIIGGEFLEGAIYAVKNPLNETGKHFADYFILPELNHHLLEGLGFPENLTNIMFFLIINSKFYSEPIKKRLSLTKEVIQQNGISAVEVELKGETKLEQVFELVQFGSFLSFYLAILHKTDPVPVPWVDYFKKKLADMK